MACLQSLQRTTGTASTGLAFRIIPINVFQPSAKARFWKVPAWLPQLQGLSDQSNPPLYFPFLSYIIKKRFIFSLRGEASGTGHRALLFCFLSLPRLLARGGRMLAHVIWLFLAHPKPKDSTTTIFLGNIHQDFRCPHPGFPPLCVPALPSATLLPLFCLCAALSRQGNTPAFVRFRIQWCGPPELHRLAQVAPPCAYLVCRMELAGIPEPAMPLALQNCLYWAFSLSCTLPYTRRRTYYCIHKAICSLWPLAHPAYCWGSNPDHALLRFGALPPPGW